MPDAALQYKYRDSRSPPVGFVQAEKVTRSEETDIQSIKDHTKRREASANKEQRKMRTFSRSFSTFIIKY